MKVTTDVMLAFTQRNNDGMYTPSVTVDSATVSYVEKKCEKRYIAYSASFSLLIYD